MFKFKVGQKYKTVNGHCVEITDINKKRRFCITGKTVANYTYRWDEHGIYEYPLAQDYNIDYLIEDVPTVKGNEMKHRNHEFITAFINGEAVQYKFASGDWCDITNLRDLDYEVVYRMKPKTKTINGFEVPMPMDKEPEKDTPYYYPSVILESFYDASYYTSTWDERIYKRGLCFSNKEDAIKTTKAMLGIDPNT